MQNTNTAFFCYSKGYDRQEGITITWRVKKLNLKDAAAGMVIGRTMVAESGIIQFSENTILTDSLIEKIADLGYSCVEIKEFCPDAAETIKDTILAHNNFVEKHAELVNDLKVIYDGAADTGEVDLPRVFTLADQCALAIANTGIVSYLSIPYATGDYIYKHSLNVAIIAGLIGKCLGMDAPTIWTLTVTGLLHDIGKSQIPCEILDKPGRLSQNELDIAKDHPAMGFELLKSTRLTKPVLMGILQHHERLDGSGYPHGLRGDLINTHARIVAIADIYDAMHSNKPYASADTPFAVIEELLREMFSRIDPLICTVFLDRIREAMVGHTVRLSDGGTAKIIYMDKNRTAQQPVVQMADGQCIDLETRKNLTIVEVIVN